MMSNRNLEIQVLIVIGTQNLPTNNEAWVCLACQFLQQELHALMSLHLQSTSYPTKSSVQRKSGWWFQHPIDTCHMSLGSVQVVPWLQLFFFCQGTKTDPSQIHLDCVPTMLWPSTHQTDLWTAKRWWKQCSFSNLKPGACEDPMKSPSWWSWTTYSHISTILRY